MSQIAPQAHDSFDVHRSIQRVREAAQRRWWMVLATTILTIALVVAYMQIFPPVYLYFNSLGISLFLYIPLSISIPKSSTFVNFLVFIMTILASGW